MLPGLLLGLATSACAQEIVVADFEGETWGEWVATGDAFGKGPARGTLPNQMAVRGFLGRGLVNSFVGGDGATGTLTSPSFRIERPFLCFRIGGGNHPGETELRLEVDGKVVRSATGRDAERLLPAAFDVREFAGKTAHIVIVDRATGGWGHVNVDQIVEADAPPDPADEERRELAEADAAVAAAAAARPPDPWRPTFHFLPAANWLNDPNGLLFEPDSPGAATGWFHLFFQHNPYAADWGEMHWGHAKSRDLAHWQRLPIALGPSFLRGEEHCFSGSALHKDDGTPVLIYTSIGRRAPEQWIALPTDRSLLHWHRPAEDPVITEANHVDGEGHATGIREWRDPYLFRANGAVHCVCGGNLDVDGRARGAVQVYRAENAELTKWRWLGPLFVHPDANVGDVECPIFFPIGGRWALITSQGRPVDWFVGELDATTMRFRPTQRGKVDLGCVYAPSVLYEGIAAPVLFGWIDGFPKRAGWRHCMTLPRRLELDEHGELVAAPAPELAALRDPARHERHADVVVDPSTPFHFDLDADVLEFELEGGEMESLRLSIGATEIAVRDLVQSEEAGATGGRAAAPALPSLHGFVDHSVVELYAGGRSLARVVAPPPDGRLALCVARRTVLHLIEAWKMKSAFE